MIILLPFPPSVNSYWKQAVIKKRGGGSFRTVVLSSRAKQFRIAGLLTIKKQYPVHKIMDKPVRVLIHLHPPTLQRYDVDNFNKGILDVLTHANIWIDDELVHDLRVIKKEKQKGGAVIVKIESL